MGLGAKLNFAFFTVIIVMVIAHAGAQIIGERNSAMTAANKVINPTIAMLANETNAIQKRNERLAERLSSDPTFNSAYGARDVSGVESAVKSFVSNNGVPGFVAVIDSSGKIFYCNESSSKRGYLAKDIKEEIQNTLQSGRVWYGPAAITDSGTLSIIGMVPIKTASRTTGLVAVCQPINTDFLSGLQKKIEITAGSRNVEMALYSMKDGHVQAMTPGLFGDGGIVSSLNREGPKILKPEMERDGRLWRSFQFQTADRNVIAVVLTGVPLPDLKTAIAMILGQAAISGFIALGLAVMFSIGIAAKFNQSMKFMVQRAKDLAAQKTNLPSLEGLSGDFIELAEVIDTAVTSPRSSVKSLQGQMTRHQDELAERQRNVEEANTKVDAVNKQLMIQSKQLSEVSKQINYANTQAVLLQQKLASVLQISTEGYLILDPYGNVISANPTFLNWAGCNEGEVAGRFCFDLVRKPGEGREGNNGGAFQHHSGSPGDLIGQFFPEGMVFNTRQDKQVEVLAHLQPVMTDDHNIQGYIMVLRDKSLHSEAARLRNEIISMLQEQIRAPLAVAEQKWDPVLSSINGQTGSSLTEIHQTYQQLLGVVDSLLMIHTGIMPTNPVTHAQVSITRLIGDSLEQVAQQARAHQIMLDYKTMTGLPTTALDKQIVRDTVIQLLEKMIAVTAPGGRVRVESAAKGTEIRISISSSGPALPPHEVEDMFIGFIEGKHHQDTYGERLNLYLVRNNIERIGGRIWAESDRGSYMYLLLPVV